MFTTIVLIWVAASLTLFLVALCQEVVKGKVSDNRTLAKGLALSFVASPIVPIYLIMLLCFHPHRRYDVRGFERRGGW